MYRLYIRPRSVFNRQLYQIISCFFVQSTIHNHFLHIFSSWLHQIFSSFISVIPPSPKPGNPKREDYEYRRYGVADLFVAFEPLAYKRVVKLTDTRTAVDFAHFLRDLTEVHYSHCEKIVLVMDNLNIHSIASLYKVFDPATARHIVSPLPARTAAQIHVYRHNDAGSAFNVRLLAHFVTIIFLFTTKIR